MKKKYCLFSLIFTIFILLISINNNAYAHNLDEIENYIVTVDPRMNDASLDITYAISWKVLDSTTEGPLTWVKIGTPNDNFTNPTALTENIKSIGKYDGAYVRITFDKAYYAGDIITFKYSIHQNSMCQKTLSGYKYKFTPAWFTDANVKNLTIRWNAGSVKESDSKQKDGNYLTWNKKDMANGEKLTANITYNKGAFATVGSNYKSNNNDYSYMAIILVFFVAMIALRIVNGGGYYRHRGFFGGYGGGYYGGCAHSSCACASSCASSCACACAGSGRAGCSRKDFYGTNITTEKLKNAMK